MLSYLIVHMQPILTIHEFLQISSKFHYKIYKGLMALSPLNCRVLPSKLWNREIINLFEILKINKLFFVATKFR